MMLFRRSYDARNRCARAAVGSFAVLALVAQLATVAHLALVTHVTCLEHGELVDVPAPAAAGVAGDSPRAEAHVVAAQQSQHGHDHCPIAALRRQRVLPQSRAHARSIVTAETRHDWLAAPAESARAIALLDVAPKTSPPLV
ncbi:MAG TPA: hypothetical protein VIA18_09585 [Polyangia bacterium]|nr:hypothetical protein [Polyangia bacterium]